MVVDPPSAGRPPVLTVGHSNHSLAKLLSLLRQHQVDLLLDVRSEPYSRYSPHFSQKPLQRAVEEAQVRYRFAGDALGGRPKPRSCYDADGKLVYDRVEALPAYQAGIESVLADAARFRVCLLCAEEDPGRCHRRLLITRTLIARAVDVRHIRRDGSVETEDQVRARTEGEQLPLLL